MPIDQDNVNWALFGGIAAAGLIFGAVATEALVTRGRRRNALLVDLVKQLQQGQEVMVQGGKDAIGHAREPYVGRVRRFPGSSGETEGEVYVIGRDGGGAWVNAAHLFDVVPAPKEESSL